MAQLLSVTTPPSMTPRRFPTASAAEVKSIFSLKTPPLPKLPHSLKLWQHPCRASNGLSPQYCHRQHTPASPASFWICTETFSSLQTLSRRKRSSISALTSAVPSPTQVQITPALAISSANALHLHNASSSSAQAKTPNLSPSWPHNSAGRSSSPTVVASTLDQNASPRHTTFWSSHMRTRLTSLLTMSSS